MIFRSFSSNNIICPIGKSRPIRIFVLSLIVKYSMGSTKPKRKPKQKGTRKPYVKRACTHCKTAHTACDSNRPCKRCTQLGIAHECIDAERKKPATRKPRKKKKEEDQDYYPSLKEYLPFLPTLEYSSNQLIPTYGSIGPIIPQPMIPNTTTIVPNTMITQTPIYPQFTNPSNFQPTFYLPSNQTQQIVQQIAPNQSTSIVPSSPKNVNRDENIDLYMDLSALNPFEDQIEFDQTEQTVQSPVKSIIQDKEDKEEDKNLQIVPFHLQEKKGTLTNYQLEELLKMVWQKQQNQTEELKEIKQVVSELKNLIISSNPKK